MESLREAFNSKYPKYSGRILKTFEKVNGCSATWDNLSKPRLAKFVSGMQEEVSQSSARTYCAMFKAVLSLYAEEVNVPKGYDAILTVKKDGNINTWLTDEEIEKVLKYTPENNSEWIVRNQFVIGCLTGARHSDYIGFTRENFSGGTLRYVAEKTTSNVEVPLSPAVKRLIEENEEMGFVGEVFSTTHFNNLIREICKKAGVRQKTKVYKAGKYKEGEKWKFIGSHSARRSFATNIYLRCTDLYMICKLMGHSSVDQTIKYICCGIREIPDSVAGYFSNFS